LPVDQQFRYLQYPHGLAPISVEICYVQPVAQGITVTVRHLWRNTVDSG
jgi:hypothetical protein